VQDPQGLNMPDKNLSRDPSRTPMPWSNEENAGFTEGKPWLRLDRTYPRVNVQVQKEDSFSMLSFYRRLISLRQQEPSLMYGNYIPVYSDRQLMAFKRSIEGHPAFLIVLNLSHRPCYFRYPVNGTIVISTYPEADGIAVTDNINLSGDEGVIVQLAAGT
jgi:alpha-glucosidase